MRRAPLTSSASPLLSVLVFALGLLPRAQAEPESTPAVDVAALVAAARAALNAGEPTRAAELATQATSAAPDREEGWLVLGLAEFRAGHDEKARSAFERAVLLAPGSAVARFNLGSTLFELHLYAEAQESFRIAATLDEAVAPLALFNAGQAAEQLDRLGDAIALYQQAEVRARERGATSLTERAAQALDAARERRVREGYDRMRELARAGKEALQRDDVAEARASYQTALGVAGDVGADPADRAELYFGLGCAELRADAYGAAVTAFDASTRLAPDESAFHMMLGVANYRAESYARAETEFETAISQGLSPADQKRAETYLGVIWNRRLDWRRYSVDARASIGFDTNVAQSGTVIAVSSSYPSSQTAAPFIDADLDAQWRPIGDFRNGLVAEYHFNQLAYFDVPSTLDTYSLQTNDVIADGTWTPARWLTLDATVDAFLMFSGIETFGPFEDGITLGLRGAAREGAHFETTVRYEHTWQSALDKTYSYLTGSRDEVAVGESARNDFGRLTLAYRFRLLQVGSQVVPTNALYFPCPAGPAGSPPCPPDKNNAYVIPYSYQSNEISLSGVAYLPWALRALADIRYDYRPYLDESFIRRPKNPLLPLLPTTYYRQSRTDNIITIDASLNKAFGRNLSLELNYTVIFNASTVNNTDPATRLDYDNENFVKQVIELALVVSF
jgi:tetratricopeptide (TPR) repeat protein